MNCQLKVQASTILRHAWLKSGFCRSEGDKTDEPLKARGVSGSWFCLIRRLLSHRWVLCPGFFCMGTQTLLMYSPGLRLAGYCEARSHL